MLCALLMLMHINTSWQTEFNFPIILTHSDLFLHVKWNYYSVSFVRRINQRSFVMVHGRNGGAGGGGRKIVASDMRCLGVLLGIARQCSGARFHCRQQHSSQERPCTKVLATSLWSPSCTGICITGGEVVSEVIILFLPFGIPVAVRFDLSLWSSMRPVPPGFLPSRHQKS